MPFPWSAIRAQAKEGLGLSVDDQAALVAFLETLTDPKYNTPPMKLYLPLLTLATLAVGHADPLITSWDTGISGNYARFYETDASEAAGNAVTTWNRGQGVQAMPT